MRVLIIGQGAREHAFAWKMSLSQDVETVFIAPGNAGTAQEKKIINVPIDSLDIPGLIHFAKHNHITFTLVGPEAPLALGIVDAFHAENLPCLGPDHYCAQLESSKVFSKNFMQDLNIPTAQSATFDDLDKAITYLKNHTYPLVIKVDGLAAGKGVFILDTFESAQNTAQAILQEKHFGEAGNAIIIEDFLVGQEISYIVLADGKDFIPLALTQDHKKRDEGDLGPNTGGMGAYSPTRFLNPTQETWINNHIIEPVLEEMQKRGHPYKGFLFAGLMISPEGKIFVLEFNCRSGDPETQVILMRLQSDFAQLCLAALEEKLASYPLLWDPQTAITVVMANQGYPDTYPRGDKIHGLEQAKNTKAKIFHAGTLAKDEDILAQGGRVLCVTTLAPSLTEAREIAYQTIDKISWPHAYYRRDIGHHDLS